MMAAGLPVVDLHGPNNIYDMPDSGVVLADPQPEHLAAALLALLHDPEGRARRSAQAAAFMADRALARGYAQFVAAVEALSANPPRVAGETESLYEMLKNVSYFFRAMGRKRVQLTAEVLKKEPEIMESAMRVFFQWYTGPLETMRGKPSLKTLYASASFLIDTFGGRSYLLRRDSKIRLLSIYYCIQVLDRANDQKMNPNGVDIRPLIAAATRDIGSQKGLAYQKQYLAELERLARKYPG
jgi:hypothetical protein